MPTSLTLLEVFTAQPLAGNRSDHSNSVEGFVLKSIRVPILLWSFSILTSDSDCLTLASMQL